MIEEVISKLDQRGLMVLTVLIGKRMMEILKSETKELNLGITNDTKVLPPTPKVIV